MKGKTGEDRGRLGKTGEDWGRVGKGSAIRDFLTADH